MYIVTIDNGTPVEVHNEHHKLFSGSVVQGINVIDSFTFSMLPDNPAFGNLHDYLTLVSVYNVAKKRYEFQGRVLCSSPSMDESGLITQEATCESYMGFLCDSVQEYQAEDNRTVRQLLQHVLDVHNSQVDDYQKFELGSVWGEGDNLYEGIQRENTWDTIQKKLIEKHGGEIRFRVNGSGRLVLDYVEKFGEEKTTELALSRNMKSITKEKDPSAFVTRLIPLGAKLSDDTEERLTIESVNGGVKYIDDAEAIAQYGIHVGSVEFDDVTEAQNLLSKGRAWLKENNKVLVKYSVTALDLSLIGLDIDDFVVYNTYPIKNALLGIDDTARVTKKTINVCEDSKTSFEIGESFKSLSEIQREQKKALSYDIAEIKRNFVTNQKLNSTTRSIESLIEQTEQNIRMSISESYASYAELEELEARMAQLSMESGEIRAEVSSFSSNYASIEALEGVVGAFDKYTPTSELEENFVTKDFFSTRLSSELVVTRQAIYASVSAEYATKSALDGVSGTVKTISAELSLKIDESELISKINASANEITITSDHFKLAADGSVIASNLSITNGLVRIARADTGIFEYAGSALQGTVTTIIGEGRGVIVESDYNYADLYGDPSVTHSGYDFYPAMRYAANEILFGYHPDATTKLILSNNSLSNRGYDVVMWGDWQVYGNIINAQGDVAVASDANRKHDIEALDSRYDTFFDSLASNRFKYNAGTSDRYHTGFIAQDVQTALSDAGISEKEFAGICTVRDGTENFLALRYGEFIALNTWQIQKLKAKIKELEERITAQ